MNEVRHQAGKHKPSVLVLMPDYPASIGSGGPVRSYHFAKAITRFAAVSACVLADKSAGEFPEDLRQDCESVYEPRVAVSATDCKGGLRAAAAILAMPWRDHGRELINAGNANCLIRAENKSQRFSLSHRFYGSLLQLQASIVGRVCSIFPSDTQYRWRQFRAILAEIQSAFQQSPTLILCEHSYLYPLAEILHERFPASRLVINAHNVEWLLKQGVAKTLRSARARRWMLTESRILRQWEQRMLSRADLIYCCSLQDRDRLSQLAPVGKRARIEVIANGVDTVHFQPQLRSSSVPTLLFTGTAGYPPNDDAVAWLTSEIFPLIQGSMPECRLILAGRNAGVHWQRLIGNNSQIQILSNVPDMRFVLANATVCVVPLRSGSGTRLKILEAMASGRSVVSTSIGAEGIDATDGYHIILADTAAAFAASVQTALVSESQRQSLEAAGRALVCDQYDWPGLMDEAMESVTELLL